MKFRIFSIPFEKDTGFDNEEIGSFCDENEILELKEHWFEHEGSPWLAVLVVYRDLDKGRAAGDGVPVYLVFNNRHLAEIARRRPETKAALAEIPGIGKGKIERYFDDVLSLLNQMVPRRGRTRILGLGEFRAQHGGILAPGQHLQSEKCGHPDGAAGGQGNTRRTVSTAAVPVLRPWPGSDPVPGKSTSKAAHR